MGDSPSLAASRFGRSAADMLESSAFDPRTAIGIPRLMHPWLHQIGKRGLYAGAILGGIGCVGMLALQAGVRALGEESTSVDRALLIGLALAATGFVCGALFEAIAGGLRVLTGRKLVEPPKQEEQLLPPEIGAEP